MIVYVSWSDCIFFDRLGPGVFILFICFANHNEYGLVFDKRVVDPVTKRSFPFGCTRVDSDIADLMELLSSQE